MKAISSLFGGGDDSGQREALAMQKKNQADIDERRKQEEVRKQATLSMLRGLQGQGSDTLFGETGAAGLRNVLG